MSTPPPISVPPTENTPEQCDAILGLYMRTWDHVEIQIPMLIQKLMGVHQSIAAVLTTAGLNSPTMRDMLLSTARFRLSERDQRAFDGLVRRWKEAMTKRNRIVHGQWGLFIRDDKHPEGRLRRAKWVRFFNLGDPSIDSLELMANRSTKTRAKHIAELSDIEGAGVAVLTLAKELEAFHLAFVPLPFIDPLPANIPP